MNDVNGTTSSRSMKTLAVVGFAVIVVFLVWLAIQLVSLLPGAFASLASMAEDVYNRERPTDTITIETSGSVANSQESFTISWNDNGQRGHYNLSYTCVDGVSLSVRLPNNVIDSVNCDEDYQLPNDTLTVNMSFASEKERFVDVSYRIAFVPEGQNTSSVEAGKIITLVNPAIPATGQVAGADDTNDNEPEAEEPAPTTPTGPATPTYRYVYTTTYKKPVSDPNGYTDLAVTYVGVGILQNGRFISTNKLDTNDNGAFQFKVKNIGTKDSTTWSYEADLPNDLSYNAKTQAILKPNEESLITIVFGRVDDTGNQKFGAKIHGGNDVNNQNNSFVSTVRVND